MHHVAACVLLVLVVKTNAHIKSYKTNVEEYAFCSILDGLIDRYLNSASVSTHKDANLTAWNRILSLVRDDVNTPGHEAVMAWTRRACTADLWQRYINATPMPACTVSENKILQSAGHGAAGSRVHSKTSARKASNSPIVSVLIGTTSRGSSSHFVKDQVVTKNILPSIAKTVECNIGYKVFVGIDAGDQVFDTALGHRDLAHWFRINVQIPLNKRGISIKLYVVRVENEARKPGPVFNALAEQAYRLGSDYFFRVNDDTIIVTPWATKFIASLRLLGPPYGVVGPTESLRPDILTHDFVHRTHVDIFSTYYPEVLSDWWMDDWISRVYGSARSIKLRDVKVLHYSDDIKWRRYDVDESHSALVDPLVHSGRNEILKYSYAMIKSQLSQSSYFDGGYLTVV